MCENFLNFSQNFCLWRVHNTYAVKLSITDLLKFNRKWRKRYNGRLWKMQMWSDSYLVTSECKRWMLDYDRNFIHLTHWAWQTCLLLTCVFYTVGWSILLSLCRFVQSICHPVSHLLLPSSVPSMLVFEMTELSCVFGTSQYWSQYLQNCLLSVFLTRPYLQSAFVSFFLPLFLVGWWSLCCQCHVFASSNFLVFYPTHSLTCHSHPSMTLQVSFQTLISCPTSYNFFKSAITHHCDIRHFKVM